MPTPSGMSSMPVPMSRSSKTTPHVEGAGVYVDVEVVDDVPENEEFETKDVDEDDENACARAIIIKCHYCVWINNDNGGDNLTLRVRRMLYVGLEKRLEAHESLSNYNSTYFIFIYYYVTIYIIQYYVLRCSS
jgi:hypothetical protein